MFYYDQDNNLLTLAKTTPASLPTIYGQYVVTNPNAGGPIMSPNPGSSTALATCEWPDGSVREFAITCLARTSG